MALEALYNSEATITPRTETGDGRVDGEPFTVPAVVAPRKAERRSGGSQAAAGQATVYLETGVDVQPGYLLTVVGGSAPYTVTDVAAWAGGGVEFQEVRVG